MVVPAARKRRILLLGILLVYTVSFFLPALVNSDPHYDDERTMPGWRAAFVSILLLKLTFFPIKLMFFPIGALAGGTNPAFLLALAFLWYDRPRPARVASLFGCVGVGVCVWLAKATEGGDTFNHPFDTFAVGFYMWSASLLAVTALSIADATSSVDGRADALLDDARGEKHSVPPGR